MTRSPVPVHVIAVAAGVALGWLGAGPLSSLSWGNVLIWAVANVGIGLIAGSQGEKVVRLTLYGFSLGFAFLSFGYSGTASLMTRTPFFAVLGLFCAVCAVLLGGLVHLVLSRPGR